MLKLAEVDIGENDRPVDPHKINRTKVSDAHTYSYPMSAASKATLYLPVWGNIQFQILHNPFDDILPRATKKTSSQSTDGKKKKKITAKATKLGIELLDSVNCVY